MKGASVKFLYTKLGSFLMGRQLICYTISTQNKQNFEELMF